MSKSNATNDGTPVTLIGVPYAFGTKDMSLAQGPRVTLAERNLPSRLREEGVDFRVEWVDADEPLPEDHLIPGDQMSRVWAQNRRLADLVLAAREEDRVPVMVCGGCATAMGVVSAIAGPDLGFIWIDAHSDADTPDASVHASIEGMPAAILAGKAYQSWVSRLPNWEPIDESRVVTVDVHTLDPGSPEIVAGDAMATLGEWVGRAEIDGEGGIVQALKGAFGRLSERGAKRVYLHVDQDSLDEDEARANAFTVPGGLSVAELKDAVNVAIEELQVDAISFTAYDPEIDPRMESVTTEIVAAAVASLQAAAGPGQGSGRSIPT